VIADSDGKAGVVIFTDSADEIAIAKSYAMREVIESCPNCKVLAVEDASFSDVTARMPPLTTALQQRHGDEWPHALGINDLYFDFMAPSLIWASIPGDGQPHNVSVGDGSEVAFQLIRTDQYQVGTVAESLRLHGWQVVDELNRAFAGEEPTEYVAPAHLFVPFSIEFDGGPRNIHDPENGYHDAYRQIWGVK
jgi:ribose transport system substrate-binding protein